MPGGISASIGVEGNFSCSLMLLRHSRPLLRYPKVERQIMSSMLSRLLHFKAESHDARDETTD